MDQRIFWGTNVYEDVLDFLFFGHTDVLDFLEFQLKLFFFFSRILDPFHLGALGLSLIGLVEGPALITWLVFHDFGMIIMVLVQRNQFN